MAKDMRSGTSLGRLRRMGLAGAPDDPVGWVEQPVPAAGTDRRQPHGRHAARDQPAPAGAPSVAGSWDTGPDVDPDVDPGAYPGAVGGDGQVGAVGAPAPPRWRFSGVPVGAAVALLVLSVALVLGLGRGGPTDEVVIGPGGPAAATVRELGPAPADDVEASGSDGQPGTVGGAEAGADPAGGTGADTGVGAGAGAGAGAEASAGAGGAVGPDAGAAPPAVGVAAGPLVVHVDGAVQRPGVVSLPGGSRVSDAVAAAGGVTDEADTRRVNLARPLLDGELVVVPRPGEEPPADAAAGAGAQVQPAPGTGSQGSAPTAGAAGVGAAVDLNRADVATLVTLPGVGPVLAQRIVDHREQVGPFASVDDLTAVSGIGPAVLEGLRDGATV